MCTTDNICPICDTPAESADDLYDYGCQKCANESNEADEAFFPGYGIDRSGVFWE